MVILRVLESYKYLSFRDRLTILARLAFCACPVKEVLEKYLPEQGVILDLGCGYGIFSHLMSDLRPDGAFIGIDMSSHRIEVARKSIDYKKNLEFYVADIRDVRIPQCNAIMMIDVLYMFPYRLQEQLLRQCYEKLYSGGILVIKDNSKSPYWKYIYSYAEDVIKTKLGVYGRDVKENSSCYWDSQEFLVLLSKIGFHAIMMPLRSYLPYSGVFYVCQK
jgi:2-polyprenyl-6-hydroxyphenyl methylase/3-demethylubiquinone-9 3-methyltransferase